MINFASNYKNSLMEVSYNWLKDYLNFPYTPQELDAVLTDTGLEVESIEKTEAIPGGLKDLVVGEVLTCEKHPDADKLNITTVNAGGETLQIVCGAPNVAVGQKVVVALVGSTLYPIEGETIKIKKTKIRGIESMGMLCAEDEIGIGVSHVGIMILDASLEVGTPMAQVIKAEDDYAIEIGLTPNRADAMGHIGVARDIAAYMIEHNNGIDKIQLPKVNDFKVTNENLKIKISVNDEACLRYCGLTISGITVGESPDWMKQRMKVVGLSSINNVVDATNYVMRELGTPLHAFDAQYVGKEVNVRMAHDGETLTTIDGVVRKLTTDQLIIANAKKPMCIAGVFGGIESGVSNETTSIFLESAYFEPVSVRKTSKTHGLNTDASFRFERGVDPALTRYALERCTLLIQEIAGGQVSMNVVDIYPNPIKNLEIEFNVTNCNRLIGIQLTKEHLVSIFNSLDINVIKENGEDLLLEVPAYRVDVTREADLIEEILRIYGFNKVEIPSNLNSTIGTYEKPNKNQLQNTISEVLVNNGAYEILNNSLTNGSYVSKFGGEDLLIEDNVLMLNPLSSELDTMRQSMIFQVLETIQRNQNRQNSDLKLFEFGKIYFKKDGEFGERKCLLIAVTGKDQKDTWNTASKNASFFALRGMIDLVFNRLGLSKHLNLSSFSNSILKNGTSLYLLNKNVGQAGEINDSIAKYFGIKKKVFIAEIWWDDVLNEMNLSKTIFSELPKTFEVRRDYSLLLDEKVTFDSIAQIARKTAKKLMKDIQLFDVYEGDKLEKGKKSYAVAFYFQDPIETLKDSQIDGVMQNIRTALESQLGAELR
jgi:phenylalanyl-tRNA synthetase beta chain